MGLALRSAWTAALLLLAAMVVGGGGSLAPRAELQLQLAFAIIIIAAAALDMRYTGAPAASARLDRRVLLLAGLMLVLPVLQLLPLPPAIWQSLPGREREFTALALVGAENSWMPWSETPSRTLASLLAMLPPVLLLLLAARLTRRGRSLLLVTIVAGCLLSVALGSLQLAGGAEGGWRLYEMTHLTWLTGFQANRNAQADVLMAGLLALAAVYVAGPSGDGREEGDGRGWAVGAAVLAILLLLGTILTGSRMGIALLLLAVPIAAAIAWQGSADRARFPVPSKVALGLVAVGAIGFGLMQLAPVQRVADRFLNDGDSRQAIWADTRVAIAEVWPAGSGMGSFEPIFAASESLENVGPQYQARAHNDWLEFALEAGIPGLVVLAAIVALLIWLALRGILARLRSAADRVETAQLLAGSGILLVIALHSLVDYPLRSMSLACLAAVAAAMHFPVLTSYRPGGAVTPDRGSE